MRTLIGLMLLVPALNGAFLILSAAIEADQAVTELKKQFDHEDPEEWRRATYDFFHSEAAAYSEVLYMGHIYLFGYLAMGALGCSIGVQHKQARISACMITLTFVLFVLLAWPWIAYGPSIDTVIKAVE